MATSQAAPSPPVADDLKRQILKRYDDQVAYYWKMINGTSAPIRRLAFW
jgi:hypothetical protein